MKEIKYANYEDLPEDLKKLFQPVEYVKIPLLNNPEVAKRVIEERKRLDAENSKLNESNNNLN